MGDAVCFVYLGGKRDCLVGVVNGQSRGHGGCACVMIAVLYSQDVKHAVA